MKALNADIGVMAYVLLFAPPEFCAIPKHGMIQFHPSLLPLHRGPAAIPWAIIRGRSETGLTIFRPTPGLDEGPVILQKRVTISPDDTAASLYFDKIFPLGVEALVQAAELVVAGRATELTQDEDEATYEGWVRDAESKINWANHVDFVYDLIRGCNPAPGAWTTLNRGGRQEALSVRRQEGDGGDLRRGARQEAGRDRFGGSRRYPHPLPGRVHRLLAPAPRRRRQDQGRRRGTGGWDDPGGVTPYAIISRYSAAYSRADCAQLKSLVIAVRIICRQLGRLAWSAVAHSIVAASASAVAALEAEAGRGLVLQSGGRRVDDGVDEPAGTPYQRQRPVAERVELNEPARLKA